MNLLVGWARVMSGAALLASAVPLLGGCAAQAADEGASLVAVVPAVPVTVESGAYVTLADPDDPAAVAVVAPIAAARPPDPGCVPDDTACLEAACARGSGHGCEARGDVYQARDDLKALAFYGRALSAYQAACGRDDADACEDVARLSAPGYGAHTYIAETAGCGDGYVLSSSGCVAAASSGPVGTTVVVNGNHNVVQVFGGAAKVVGTSAKKTRTAHSEAP